MIKKITLCATLCLLCLCATLQAQNIDSLYTVFSNSKGEHLIRVANEIVTYCYENEYLDSLTTLKTSDGKAFVNAVVDEAMGNYFSYEKADYKKSIAFFKQALEHFEKNEEFTAVNTLNGNIGADYGRIGDYENAVTYILKCYEWEKSVNDKEGLSSTLSNLGVIYSQWGKREEAIRYFEAAAEVERSLNRPVKYANRLASLAKEYSFADPQKALPIIKEALQYDQQIDSPSLQEDRIAVHTIIMGDIYYEMDSLKQAEKYYRISLNIFQKNNRTYYVANTLLGLGLVQMKAKNYPEAIIVLKPCHEIAENNNFLSIQRTACYALSKAYHHLEPNSLAFYYLDKYDELNYSMFNETTQQQLNDFQVKYETAEKELEIERQQVTIQQQHNRLIITLLIFCFLITMLILIVIQRTRRNRILAEMNTIKDKFFSIISHDLKNPVIMQHNALQLLADNTGKWDADTLSDYSALLLKSSDELMDLLRNLLDWSLLQRGRKNYNPTMFNLVAALQPEINVIKNMAERKSITFEMPVIDTAIVTADQNMLKTVIRNLLANAVKFTASGGTVTLEIGRKGEGEKEKGEEGKENGYFISVIDTGIGMSPEQIRNLFRIDTSHFQRGTAGEQGTGLGLIVCKEMLEKHGSRLHIESEEGKGSQFWFTV